MSQSFVDADRSHIALNPDAIFCPLESLLSVLSIVRSHINPVFAFPENVADVIVVNVAAPLTFIQMFAVASVAVTIEHPPTKRSAR